MVLICSDEDTVDTVPSLETTQQASAAFFCVLAWCSSLVFLKHHRDLSDGVSDGVSDGILQHALGTAARAGMSSRLTRGTSQDNMRLRNSRGGSTAVLAAKYFVVQ